MSPFALYLRELRLNRGYKQKELAHLLGYEPSYISALERSKKGPPKRDFVDRLIRGLQLSNDEQIALAQDLKQSRRQILIPLDASEREYALLHHLESQLGQLNSTQIQLIELALQITVIRDHPAQLSV